MRLEDFGREAVVAVEATCDAVRFARETHYAADAGRLTKTDASPVTALDFALQAFLVSRLADHFPSDPIVAEEDAGPLRTADAEALRSHVIEWVTQMLRPAVQDAEQVLASIDRGSGQCGERFWTLDPIDGTKGLLRGGQYVIALALVSNGRVEFAVLGCPRLSVTTGPPSPSGRADLQAPAVMMLVEDDVEGGVAVAVRDKGAWWMSLRGSLTRLSVSAETRPERIRVVHSFEPGHTDIAAVHRVLRGLGVQEPPILMDSQAKHVLLAAGTGELLLRFPIDRAYHEAIWDHAAGSLLIEEAGGRVTDVEGRPLDFTTGRRLVRNTGLVASNRLLHETVLGMIGTTSRQ